MISTVKRVSDDHQRKAFRAGKKERTARKKERGRLKMICLIKAVPVSKKFRTREERVKVKTTRRPRRHSSAQLCKRLAKCGNTLKGVPDEGNSAIQPLMKK